MDWIAEQYNLRLEDNYKTKASCSQGSGNKEDINKDVCWTSDRLRCNWTATLDEDVEKKPYDSCRLSADEGIARNVFQCLVSLNETEVSAVPPLSQCPLTLL